MSSDEIPSGSRTHNDDEAPSTSNQGRGRNLSESSDQGSKRQRTLSESFFPGLTNASPPKFVSLEEIISAAKGMANMALAHEIAVDSNFELEKREPPENSLHRRVKETMLKAFWDILSQQLQEDPPNYTQGLVLLSEIKETLLTLLLPHNTKLKEEIEEVLDIELIRQQVENGSLDFPYYANYVTSVMAKLCTPARDDCIRKLKQETDTVSVFKGILETLELMRIDMANFTIEMYRPLLVASSVDYEKSKFKEYIKVNPDGLEVTKQWLFRHVSPSTSLASADDWREVIAQAYLELLTWDDSNAFPETLVMDRSRLAELRNEVLRVTVAATVLLLVVSSVPQLQSNAAFKVSLKNHMLLLLQQHMILERDLEGSIGLELRYGTDHQEQHCGSNCYPQNLIAQFCQSGAVHNQCLRESIGIIPSEQFQVSLCDHFPPVIGRSQRGRGRNMAKQPLFRHFQTIWVYLDILLKLRFLVVNTGSH
uniref:T-complex protein 11-like protein 1 n=1 Tax=Homalodisca liturata TaxID=320908 RepID=A0A1B6HDJ8_9HEMI